MRGGNNHQSKKLEIHILGGGALDEALTVPGNIPDKRKIWRTIYEVIGNG